MSPRNGNPASKAHQFGEHHRARHHGNSSLASRNHFGIVRFNGRRNHHNISALDVLGRMFMENLNAQPLQSFRGRIRSHVGAGHLITQSHQHLGDTVHTGSADTHKVNFINRKSHDIFALLAHFRNYYFAKRSIVSATV